MEALLAKLRELSLPHEPVAHAAAMTVEEQAEALKAHPTPVTKNLFLKDKKGRLFVVTALPDTKINMNILSARLGSGKSGLRMAPDELLPAILGVSLGSVTPLALAAPTATDVVLLADIKLKSFPAFFVHPLVNTASLALTADQLDAYLTAAGRSPAHWVDLEADPKIDRENPPDLKPIADAAKAMAKDDAAAGEGANGAVGAAAAAPKKEDKKKKGGDGKDSGKGKSDKDAAAAAAARAALDVYAVADSVMAKVLGAAGGAGVEGDALRRLRADVVMELNALRNAAYSTGFKSAQGAVVASITGAHA